MARLNINAVGFQTILTSGFTQAQFITFIKDNLANCGFPTPVETVGTNPKILAYDLQISAHARNRYWYVVHIPTFTTTFTLTHGLFEYSNYNTTTFLRTANHIGALDALLTTNPLPSGSAVALTNANSYTAYDFPTTLEYRGVGLRTNNAGNLAFFLGVTYPETIFNHIDRNTSTTLGLVTNINQIALGARAVNAVNIPHPCLTSAAASSTNNQVNVSNFLYPANPTYIVGGMELITSASYIAYATTPSFTGLIGKYSADIAYGSLGSFSFGTIVQVNPGVEEYFVMSSGNPGWAIRVLN